MRVFLFGTGAMSCLFAARLAGAAQVTLLGTWGEAIDAIRERGILFEESHESRTARVEAEFLGATLAPLSSDFPRGAPANRALRKRAGWGTSPRPAPCGDHDPETNGTREC